MLWFKLLEPPYYLRSPEAPVVLQKEPWNITFAVDATANDGNSPITGYRITCQSIFAVRKNSSFIGNTPYTRANSVIVKIAVQLHPGDVFMCSSQAVNAIGASVGSSITLIATPKEGKRGRTTIVICKEHRVLR